MNAIWVVDAGTVPYGVADEWQRELHRRRAAGEVPDVLLLLEHPHVYTLGRRFALEHLLLDESALAARGIEVHECDRGGSITYHGPGQLVGYPVVDLRRRGAPEDQPDVIRYLRTLEEGLIRAVRSFGVIAGRRPGLTGVWFGEAKLASIGVNVSRGVSRHGFALNVTTDLSYFAGMVPCGIPEVRMTSLAEILRLPTALAEVASEVAARLAQVLHRRVVPATAEDLELPGLPAVLPGARMQKGAGVIEFPRKPLDAPRSGRAASGGLPGGGGEDAN